MKTVLLIGAGLAALCLAVIWHLSPARADPAAVCGELQPMLKQLVGRYHEFVVMTGDATGNQMVVTMSAAGTFTVLVTKDGRACVVLVGEKAEFDNGI